jgi:hypothetical protein
VFVAFFGIGFNQVSGLIYVILSGLFALLHSPNTQCLSHGL